MACANHGYVWRPVRGGVAVYNPAVLSTGRGPQGTIGFVASSDDGDRWIVSCYHVLCRCDGTAPLDGEPIYQPFGSGPVNIIAETDLSRTDATLDAAAARLLPGVDSSGGIVDLRTLSTAVAPAVGQRVIKSGYATGVTEGVVTKVTGDIVEIEVHGDFPLQYVLSAGGDSGAAWVERDSGALVALHTGGAGSAQRLAFGVSIPKVLSVLGLKEVID